MKKLSTLVAVAMTLLPLAASAAVTVRYYNRDSQKHTYPAVCSGSQYTVSFDGSTTSSTTIQGSSPCTVKTPAGDVVLKGGENIEIQNGKISIK
ncbi:MAG TPA: hypothetical protein PKO07_21695 [Pseudomonadota bacterium]|nr:hypothetical protein [Pseudomonadota bacterium]HNN53659.1 hypothetical protein [Pseudomonadota bacterium]